MADAFRASAHGEPAPTKKHEYLLYQSILGAWPVGWDGKRDRDAFVERLVAFLEKAGKEAKEVTSWTNPDSRYDELSAVFVRRIFESDALVDAIRRFAELIAPYGAANGLATTVLRLCSPGVPDTYQGAELWNQSLVDPDNRRPVDFGRRRDTLATIRGRLGEPLPLAKELVGAFADGRVKLFTLHVGLMARRADRDLFLRGDYDALPGGQHVVAFTRGFEERRFICAVPRHSFLKTRGALPFAVGDVWADEALEVPHAGRYKNLFTGAEHEISGNVALRELFSDFPVALLVRERTPS
jgi:(1->4)-alpha-D-glucan 1-alpha-D-glucosylmutase